MFWVINERHTSRAVRPCRYVTQAKGSVTLCDAEVSTAIIPRTLSDKGGMLGAVELRHRDCHVEMRVNGKYDTCIASGGWRRGIGHIMPS